MRKVMCNTHIKRMSGFIFTIAILGAVFMSPAYAAVPRRNHYQALPWYWFGWPVISRPGAPSLPRDSQPLPNPVSNGGANQNAPARNLTSDENYILKQVNIERAKAGLAPLQIDNRLVQTARAKSRDMIDHGYFGHQSPILGNPFDQMKKAGVSYRYAGENIAGNLSAAGAMVSWMNSSGHKANILNPNFNHIGIGVIEGGPYGKMLTQQFIG